MNNFGKEKESLCEPERPTLDVSDFVERERAAVDVATRRSLAEPDPFLKKLLHRGALVSVLTSLLAFGNAESSRAERQEKYNFAAEKSVAGDVLRSATSAEPDVSVESARGQAEHRPEHRRAVMWEWARIAEESAVEENLSFLKKTFFGSSYFAQFVGAKWHIEDDMELLRRANDSNDKSVIENDAMFLNAFDKRWRSSEPLLRDVDVSGFESLGVSSKEILKGLNERYGIRLIAGSLKSIAYHNMFSLNIVGMLRDNYKPDDAAVIELYLPPPHTLDEKWQKSDVREIPKDVLLANVHSTLRHEIGHLNSWENSRLLTSAERVQFAADAARRYAQHDSRLIDLTADYITGIAPEDAPYMRLCEWWAETVRFYFEDRDEFKKTYPEDFAFADKWIVKMSTAPHARGARGM